MLKCFYDIEDDSLYSVKWYKGRREFYRFTPKETPPMKVFHFPGVKVRRSSSNESQVVLDAVTMQTSGKYSCEVSADAPSFHTLIAAAELEVIETPHNAPFINGIRPRYRVGDILRGNCTSRHSRPAANLTWTVNNEEVNPSHVRHHKILRDIRNDMETSIVGIHFVVTDQHFDNGKLKLRCSAQLHDVYWKTTEKTILEADPFGKYGSSGASGNRVGADEIYDQYTLHEDEQFHSKKNSYLTQLQGEEDDGADGLEDGGAAWRGVSSASSQSVTVGGATATATLLALLSWSLGRQLGSQLAPITKNRPMRAEAVVVQQKQRQRLRVPNCRSCTCTSSKECSRCSRQLT
ncbi:GH10395 [Drosophila grimshawi]|uniref:GH10395 n=2 Tax=Drosophila grimshawi TaxID=7222 RepID=B4JEC1_DROGR|nr:GH10395 [Drosophila grimshawi]